MKSRFFGILVCSLSWIFSVQAQKITQRDLNPPQKNVDGGGSVVKVEYTNHKMIVYYKAGDEGDVAERSSLHGPGHPNAWKLIDREHNQEYALLYIKNIKVDKITGPTTVEILDEPREIRFRNVLKITCEAHFERPAENAKKVDLIEEDVEHYVNRRDTYNPLSTSSQWPYNVYSLRVLPYKDDMRNSVPPATAPQRTTHAKPQQSPKPTPVPTRPAPKPAPRDTTLTQAPPVESPKPAESGKVEDFGSKVELGRTYRLSNLLFQQSDYRIQPSSFTELDTLVGLMKRNKTMEIELAGHTDNVGNPKLNVELSQKRVDAVKTYLTSKGIQPIRIKTKAYGGSRPVADNTYEATRRLNRRVEVTILKQ